MKRTKRHYTRHIKIDQSTITRIIAVVVFVLLIASLVFYLKSKISNETYTISEIIAEERFDTSMNKDNLPAKLNENVMPENIDLNTVEYNLNQADISLGTIDPLENI